MGRRCILRNCTSNYDGNIELTFHSFPLKHTDRYKQWLQAIPKDLIELPLQQYTYICSKHFSKDAYQPQTPTSKAMLCSNAIPSIFYTSNENTTEEATVEKKRSVDVCTQVSPKRIKKEITEKELVSLKREVHILRKRLHRRDESIKTMNNIIDILKTHNICNLDLEQILRNTFSGLKLEVILNECKNNNIAPTQRRYTPEIKQFALTLYFYSPKGYDLLREMLYLPHPSMLRKWIGNYNCETGFLSEVFEYLETEVKQNQFLKDVAFIFDSVAIRTQVVHDIKTDQNRGYVDYGGIVTTNSEDLATEVLVFQIVSYTNRFKCPIAYFFINKINADLQAHLIKYAIEKLYKSELLFAVIIL